MNEAIELLGVSSMGYLLAEAAEPVQIIKRWIKSKIGMHPLVEKLIDCSLCLTFWLALAYYRDLITAAVASVVAEGISRWMKNNIRF